MEKLLLTDWIALVTALGVLVALIGNLHSFRDKDKNKAAAEAELRTDVKYIREKVEKLDDIPGRMVAVEASADQAHKRIDRLEKEKEN